MSVYFNNPPINEVVIATYFKPPFDLRSEHIGLFWKQIKSEFPTVRQQPPVGTEIPVGGDVFPMPRYWFTADDGISLIQIQKNAFMFNWRRQEDAYPRYHKIKPRFDRYYALFSEFIRAEVPSSEQAIDMCELTYVNAIQECDFWAGPQDTNKILPSFCLLQPVVEGWDSVGFNCNFGFYTPERIHLQVAVRSGTTSHANSTPILVFEIKATEQVGSIPKSAADRWFDRAHTAIMDCFLEITSERIQFEQWQREQTRHE